MGNFLLFFQVLISLLLITAILLQQRGEGGLSSIFGGGGGSASYGVQRGIQKKLFIATIILGASFIALTLVNLLI